jgi:hypothetical protein
MGALKSMVMDIEADIADGILSYGVIADKHGVSRDEVEDIADRMYEDSYDDSMDGDFDSAMASAGYGTDEDYGVYDAE